jgi:uncharacterized protein (TIGR00369 family)
MYDSLKYGSTNTVNLEEISALIPELFAPWVQELNLTPVEITESADETETRSDTDRGPKTATSSGVRFILPINKNIIRSGGKGGGVVCGQALAAAADTVSVLALSHANNRFRACTTTDINIRFMRALSAEKNVSMSVTILSNGRRMAVTRIDIQSEADSKIAATATCSFMYLED